MKNKNSSWIDNIETKMRIESLDEIIYTSIENAVDNIESSYGVNHSNWKWGDAHSVTHRHLLSKVRFLNWLFDLGVGPYRTGGSDKTPNAGGYSFHKPYHQTSGASMRRIVDFSNLNPGTPTRPTNLSSSGFRFFDNPHCARRLRKNEIQEISRNFILPI